VPDLFIRGAGTYTAHVNAGNPVGTMQKHFNSMCFSHDA